MKNAGYSAIFATAALLLCGCLGPSEEYAKDPEYQMGYGDGCTTGSGQSHDIPGSVVRNAQLYETSKAYASGWRTGFNACRPISGDPLTR